MTLRVNRKILLCSAIGVCLLLVAVAAWAKGAAGVINTPHNMSNIQPIDPFYQYQSDNVDEVCVFCHTPHGGVLNGPLWNRSLPGATSFTHYNSSTLSGYLTGLSVSRSVNDESLLCMSCHDGSIAIDHLINDPNSLNGNPITIFGGWTDQQIVDLPPSPGARIGGAVGNTSGTGDLSDDHPISFSYSSVWSDPMYQGGGSKAGELNPVGNTGNSSSVLGWKGEGVRLFGTDDRVECSSCHDPHVDYITDTAYTPFLIRPNAGSDLCLACHNK